MSGGSNGSAAPRSLYPILSVNFVGSLGFSIVLPFLVFLVMRWGGNAVVYGVMGATYSVFQLVGAPILGRWSDRFGRRRILLLSQLGTLLSWAVFLLAFALPDTPLARFDSRLLGEFAVTLPLVVMFIARACDGLTGGNVSVANAYLADVTTEEDRNRNFGRMAVAANLGFIMGPAIAGVLSGTSYGEVLPVLAALAISLVASLIILLYLPESKPCVLEQDPERLNVRKVFGQEHKPCYELAPGDGLSTRGILALPGVAPLLAVYFLVMMGFNFYYVAFPVHASEGLGWSVRDVGIFFSFLSGALVIVQGPVLGWASKRWSDVALALGGSIVLAASFVCFTSEATGSLYAGAALLALGNGVMWPSVVSMLSKAAGDRHQGVVQGFASGSGSVASIVGLLLGGSLYARVGATVFLVSAATIFSVFLVFVVLLSRRRLPA